jgi:hypothetical protein
MLDKSFELEHLFNIYFESKYIKETINVEKSILAKR